ncbi:MAG: helix-turn-helix domain-containing protein [Candidatus Gracilibacteria bacterium]
MESTYSVDREKAATLLGVSTRSIDRYIKSNKIRSRKLGKKLYLHDEDVERLRVGGIQEDFVIMTGDSDSYVDTQDEAVVTLHSTPKHTMRDMVNYRELYDQANEKIAVKDKMIQELSYRLGQSETELKNTISISEYKKATFLLESAKSQGEEEKNHMIEKVSFLENSLKREHVLVKTLVITLMVTFVVSVCLWVLTLTR